MTEHLARAYGVFFSPIPGSGGRARAPNAREAAEAASGPPPASQLTTVPKLQRSSNMILNKHTLGDLFKGFQLAYNQGFEGAASRRDLVAMSVKSTGREEHYGWLGQFPGLREWVGDRHIKNLSVNGFSLANKKFETTVAVKREDIEDDRYGLFSPIFREMGRTTATHPDELLFDLLRHGFEKNCYDGQFFFDTDHEGFDANSNVISVSNYQAGDGPSWYLLDLSRSMKPLIFQERIPYTFQTVDNDANLDVFMQDEYYYGVRARVAVGFGLWQLAHASRAPLTPDNYAAVRSAMAAIRGENGRLLGISPTHLVIPPGLEKEARQILGADTINGTSNVWKGTAEFIMTPYLA